MYKINLKRRVPSHLAFLIVIVLSFFLSWFTISEGEKIIKNSKNSPAFNISNRIKINNK